jgi:hypothetical protein
MEAPVACRTVTAASFVEHENAWTFYGAKQADFSLHKYVSNAATEATALGRPRAPRRAKNVIGRRDAAAKRFLSVVLKQPSEARTSKPQQPMTHRNREAVTFQGLPWRVADT